MKSTIAWVALLLTTTFLPGAEPSKEKAPPAITEKHYRIYQANGEPATFEALMQRARATDVIILGEHHDDPVAHHLQLRILQALGEKPTSTTEEERPLALSMEMFERDVQHIVDEYLTGLINEKHFLASSRPWKNYEKDYRPLVEHAKENGMAVLAANAPRRYVNLVGREGAEALVKILEPARRGLPPLPYAEASPAYTAKFKALMEGAHGSSEKKETKKDEKKKPMPPPKRPTDPKKPPVHQFDMKKALEAQSLWDASMACTIAEHLMRSPSSRVLQINGSFHSEKRLGVPEHLLRYRPGTSILVITMIASKEFPKFEAEKMSALGDYVIVTDASLPRSYSSK